LQCIQHVSNPNASTLEPMAAMPLHVDVQPGACVSTAECLLQDSFPKAAVA